MKLAMPISLAALTASVITWGSAAPARPAATARTSTAITCSWPVGPHDSARTVLRRFGRQARMADIGIGEGETERGVILFPNDPRRRMSVLFWGEDRHAPKSVLFFAQGTPWTVAGMRLGDTLESVVQRNGRPLTLQQFDADYRGTVNSFKGGRLATIMGACEPAIVFAPSEGAQYPKSLSGDGDIDSDHPDMPKARARIDSLGVHFAPPTDQ